MALRACTRLVRQSRRPAKRRASAGSSDWSTLVFGIDATVGLPPKIEGRRLGRVANARRRYDRARPNRASRSNQSITARTAGCARMGLCSPRKSGYLSSRFRPFQKSRRRRNLSLPLDRTTPAAVIILRLDSPSVRLSEKAEPRGLACLHFLDRPTRSPVFVAGGCVRRFDRHRQRGLVSVSGFGSGF